MKKGQHAEAPAFNALRTNLSDVWKSQLRSQICMMLDSLGLTPRERTVAELQLSSLAGKEIADKLGITPKTLKQHDRAAHDKAGVNTRIEFIARVLGYA